MSDQPVVIEVKDGVDKNISRNLSEISSQARGAYQNVAKLVTQLNRVKPTAIAQFNSVVSNAQKQMALSVGGRRANVNIRIIGGLRVFHSHFIV